jgi:hypothetical protein
MALKPHRHEFQTDITFHCNDVTERGVVLVFGSSGSGDAMDDPNAVVSLAAVAGTNKPAGLLLNDMVNVNLARYHLNFNKDEMQIGGKCTLLKKGWVVTNKITGTPVAGDKAFLGANGTVTPTAGTALVGQFLSAKDSGGYAKVEVNLPNNG